MLDYLKYIHVILRKHKIKKLTIKRKKNPNPRNCKITAVIQKSRYLKFSLLRI